MKTTLLFLFALLFVSNATFSQTRWKVTNASVTFKIKNAGINVNGSFGGFQGTLLFDPASLNKGQLTASVDANSINTGISLRDNHIRKAEYFDVASFPRITLKSTALEAKGGGNFSGTFDLTLKGTTRPVTIPFTFSNGQFAGSFAIDRRDFGVGKNSLVMGDNVTITIQVQTMPTTNVADR